MPLTKLFEIQYASLHRDKILLNLYPIKWRLTLTITTANPARLLQFAAQQLLSLLLQPFKGCTFPYHPRASAIHSSRKFLQIIK